MNSTNCEKRYPEYFKSNKKNPVVSKIQTNPRYRNFCQIVFTAGDEEQFFERINNDNEESSKQPKLSKMPIPTKWVNCYDKTNYNSIIDTFRYIFHELKKGIFVQIKNNQLVTFLPFSKSNYVNEWGSELDIQDNFKNIDELIKYCQEKSGKEYIRRRILRNPKEWVANGCLLRYENPHNEGDSNITHLKHMFTTLCESKKVPNIDFFINRRDFPILRKDRKYPYVEVSDKTCVIESPCPILSMCTTDEYSDIPIPTWDDWGRICFREEKIFFTSNYINRPNKTYPKISKMNWDDKIPQAVFRGSSTGKGVTTEDNPRLKIASMKSNYLDAGITKWNIRPRVIRKDGCSVISTIMLDDLDLKLVKQMSPEDQSKYKYIVNIDGHSSAFRISLEMQMNSVIFMVESKYKLWNTYDLEEGVHYIGIKSDLSDLIEKIEWCENHPDECKEILENMKKYSRKLTKTSIINYLQKVLWKLKDNIGDYDNNVINTNDIILIKEKKKLEEVGSIIIIEEESEVLIKTKSTQITKFNNIMIKSVNDNKLGELFHEAFISKILLSYYDTKQITKLCGINDNKTVWDFIKGITLSQYIKDQFNLYEFQKIIIQICGLLQIYWEKCEFTHNDMYCWNILLVDEKFTYTYKTSRGEFDVECNKKAVLIDFGKSHLVHKNIHYGKLRAYESSSIRDTVIFIVSSCNLLSQTQLSKKELSFLFQLINFLSLKGESYHKTFRNVREIKDFTRFEKKYTQMLYSDKKELEELEPIDLLVYLEICEIKNLVSEVNKRKVNLVLHENIFNDPYEILEILKNHKINKNSKKLKDIDMFTFLNFAKIITKMNYKHIKKDIYLEILNLIPDKITN